MCTVQLRFYICVQIAEGITGTAPGDVTRRENKTVQINSGQFMTIKCILLQTFKLKKKKMFVHSFFFIIIIIFNGENNYNYFIDNNRKHLNIPW